MAAVAEPRYDSTLMHLARMVTAAAVQSAICAALPDASVSVDDLTGGGDHLQVKVTSAAFAGLSRVRQHQLVYAALKDELESAAIHALALSTSLPA